MLEAMRTISGILLASCLSLHAADPAVTELMQSRDALRDRPFSEIVESATGRKVIPVDPARHGAILHHIGRALDETLRAFDDPAHPIHQSGRVNEASRHLEDVLRDRLSAIPGWTCAIPATAEGREQRAGYPDLRIETDTGIVIYLDPKLYAAKNRDSALRTFYYEPKALTGKIQANAIHLLAGIAHDESGTRLRLTGWELVDLSRVNVRVKIEFQASNRDLYAPETVVAQSSEQGDLN
jgi:hypothetical protein